MLSHDTDVSTALARRGVTRRQLVKFCSGMLATLALPNRYLAQVVQAVGKARMPVLLWLQFQDCTGCSESMLRSSHPDVAEAVLDLLSWEYHEVIMAGAGKQADAVLNRVVNEDKRKYLAVVEGAIPTGEGFCTIGGRSAMDIAEKVCRNAAATIAVGACAFDGGLVRSAPNPTGALGVHEALPGLKVMNMSGCPHNPANTAAALVHYLTFNDLPALDQYNRPLFAYGRIIHDQCERRAHYDAGRFVVDWGDEGHRKGWCLYKMGCKGPAATFNCPVVGWNDHTSWPVRAGHGCIACASPRFWDTMSPFYDRIPSVPGFGVEASAGEIGLGLVGATVAGVTVHGLIKMFKPVPKPAPRPEPEEAVLTGKEK
ncbi:MAG TPA: hydrogenase small subunit [Bryobacteraceae bacterium]|nr:hydrogenase small subunit [Bryobacteraceae bacterium]